jgi:hypothetical protein
VKVAYQMDALLRVILSLPPRPDDEEIEVDELV